MKKQDFDSWMRGGGKMPRLGSGERFKAIKENADARGASNPAAVAAAIGIKKYGQEKMTQMAMAGKKRRK